MWIRLEVTVGPGISHTVHVPDYSMSRSLSRTMHTRQGKSIFCSFITQKANVALLYWQPEASLCPAPRSTAASLPLPLNTDTTYLGNFSAAWSRTRAGRSWQELEAEQPWQTDPVSALPSQRSSHWKTGPRPASNRPVVWSILEH